jgi:type IV secretory pathway VirB2 component (pilin)
LLSSSPPSCKLQTRAPDERAHATAAFSAGGQPAAILLSFAGASAAAPAAAPAAIHSQREHARRTLALARKTFTPTQHMQNLLAGGLASILVLVLIVLTCSGTARALSATLLVLLAVAGCTGCVWAEGRHRKLRIELKGSDESEAGALLAAEDREGRDAQP